MSVVVWSRVFDGVGKVMGMVGTLMMMRERTTNDCRRRW